MAEIFKDPRKREFLNTEGADRPLRSSIPYETLVRARAYRKKRLADAVATAGCAGILLYDPCNIRYATDVTNMQVWMLHNALHYCFIGPDEHAIIFEYKRSEHLTKGFETVDETRVARGWFYMTAGDRAEERLEAWADEIADIIRARGAGNRRLAVDKLEPAGVDALRKRGIEIVDGQRIAETARVIKNADEIALMRWTIRVCEAGMARMYDHSLPGRTENEIWAELHYENIRSGGEWLETRLLAAGQRTNPWFQESSDKVCEAGEILAFDTDMIGPYGYCADLSRSWTIGHTRMTNAQRTLYAHAREQIEHNISAMKPGMSFTEFNELSWRIPDKYVEGRYGLAFHGVGMADEWPSVPTHVDFARAYGGRLEENMTVCVESLIGEPGGAESIKLETQVLITSRGAERLDSFPFENT
ncbi:MAG: aminopeptidase P family protein [Proteobacteria bacterium]|nr:aminopeptidase P family protein [Pseudomonadota bacterium]